MNVQSSQRATVPLSRMSIDEFFVWTEGQERKYELVDGVPHLLPWVKRNHSLITTNIVVALAGSLDHERFSVHTGDFATKTGERSIRYADVMVEPVGAPGEQRTAEQAVLLVEVLSDSTAQIDFGAKLQEYQGIGSLSTYLIVSQDTRQVWSWRRDLRGAWPEQADILRKGEIPLPGLNASLTLDQIYRGVR